MSAHVSAKTACPAPPPLISPALDGWLAVVGLRGWTLDCPALASDLLSLGFSDTASCEIAGQAYRLRFARYGTSHETLFTPKDADDPTQVTAMPIYRDVEQLAFALLRDLGLPTPLILIGTRPHQCPQRNLGQALELTVADDGSLTRRTRDVAAPDYKRDEAPVLVNEIGRDFGTTLFDRRFVDGVPSAASVKRLLQLEEKIRQRAAEEYGVSEVQLDLSYSSGGYQDELDDLFRAHGRIVPERRFAPQRPWWQFWRYFGKFGR